MTTKTFDNVGDYWSSNLLCYLSIDIVWKKPHSPALYNYLKRKGKVTKFLCVIYPFDPAMKNSIDITYIQNIQNYRNYRLHLLVLSDHFVMRKLDRSNLLRV